MAVIKVVARFVNRGTQSQKKIYESERTFELYGRKLIDRWVEHYDIEVYKMQNDVYTLWFEEKAPRTKEEFDKMKSERNVNWLGIKYIDYVVKENS